MSDSFITVVIILVAALLIFVVPVIAVSARNDVTASQTVQTAITSFVDEARETGVITQESYDKLLEEIDATGNTYEVNISIQHLDENPAKKTSSSVTDTVKIGENIYYIDYTTQIEDAFAASTDGTIKLVSGDYLQVSAENTNETLYQTMKKFVYGLSSSEEGTISGTHAALITSSAEGELADTTSADVKQHTVKYDGNGKGDTVTNVPSEQVKEYGVALTLRTQKPEREGYTFVGWAETDNATTAKYSSGGTYVKEQDIVLYAVWTKTEYKVKYWANIGYAVSNLPYESESLSPNTTYTIWEGRDTPECTEGEFLYWNTSADGSGTTYNSGQVITITGNVTLYAIWKTETYKLYYNANTTDDVSNMPDTESHEYNTSFAISGKVPTRYGYLCKGWSTTADGEVEYAPGAVYKFSTPADATLYAVWKVAYNLVYNENIKVLYAVYIVDDYAGTSRETSQINTAQEMANYLNDLGDYYATVLAVYSGDIDSLLSIKDNYDVIILDCDYWATSGIGATTAQLEELAVASNIITVGNDQSSLPFISSSTHISGDSGSITQSIYETSTGETRIGVESVSSQTDNSLRYVTFNSSTKVLYKATYTLDGNKYTGDVVGFYKYYYRNWIHVQADITRFGNSLFEKLVRLAFEGWDEETEIQDVPEDEILAYAEGDTVTVSSLTPQKAGYTFLGWSEDPEATIPTYVEENTFLMPGNDVTLYAVWEICSYTVTANPNGGKWSDSSTASKSISGNAYTIQTITNPTRTGYTFTGWTVTGTGYVEVSGDTTDVYIGTSSYTITAQWKINQYTVSYDGNGGTDTVTSVPTSQTANYNSTITLSTTTPVRTGYTFKGWALTAAGDVKYQAGSSYTIPAYNQTLYAQWTINSYTFSYNANTTDTVSNLPTGGSYKYRSTVTVSSTKPTRTGYTFQGWATTSGGSVNTSYNPGKTFTMPANDVTLYAVWTVNSYTLTYNANGGSGAPTGGTYNYGTSVTVSSTKPTRSGYTFLGWATSSSATSADGSYDPGDEFTMTGNLTLYAVWKRSSSVLSYWAYDSAGKNKITATRLGDTEDSGDGYLWITDEFNIFNHWDYTFYAIGEFYAGTTITLTYGGDVRM